MKIPCDADLARRQSYASTDHDKYGSTFFGDSLGLEEGASDPLGGVFSSVSRPTADQEKADKLKAEDVANKRGP